MRDPVVSAEERMEIELNKLKAHKRDGNSIETPLIPEQGIKRSKSPGRTSLGVTGLEILQDLRFQCR